jgi:hypothetical protein
MFVVKAYDVFNNTHEFPVDTLEKGREYAKRIISEGLWVKESDGETFYPVHQVVKVRVFEEIRN